MMSRNINSMLEHLRVGPLKRNKVPSESSDDGQQKQQQDQQQSQQQSSQQGQPSSTRTTIATTTTASATITFDELSGTSSMNARGNGSVVTCSDEVDNRRGVSVLINDTRKKSLREIPNGVVGIIDGEKKFDPRKRYSISNGDLRANGKGRELSPATMKQPQRKLSADMRLRGSNNQLTDDYLLRRPVRLKTVSTNFEAYDSLHTKALDVSSHLIKFHVPFTSFYLPFYFVFVFWCFTFTFKWFASFRADCLWQLLGHGERYQTAFCYDRSDI